MSSDAANSTRIELGWRIKQSKLYFKANLYLNLVKLWAAVRVISVGKRNQKSSVLSQSVFNLVAINVLFYP